MNNKIVTNENDLKFSVFSAVENSSIINVSRLSNGDYFCEYKIYKITDIFQIVITVNNITADNLKTSIVSYANFPIGAKSKYENLTNLFNMGNNINFDLALFDPSDNSTSENVNIYIILKNKNGKRLISSALQDTIKKNTFHVTILLDKTGIFNNYCGETYLNSFILKQGIKRLYYDNLWLIGNPISELIDKSLFYESNASNNNLVINNFTSLKWKGFIKATVGEIVTFYITTINNLKFIFEDETIVDTISTNLVFPQYEFSKVLKVNQLYEIELILYISEGSNVNLKIEWMSSTISTKQIVPIENYFYLVRNFFLYSLINF